MGITNSQINCIDFSRKLAIIKVGFRNSKMRKGSLLGWPGRNTGGWPGRNTEEIQSPVRVNKNVKKKHKKNLCVLKGNWA